MKKKWKRLLKYLCGGVACMCIALAFVFMPTKSAAATEIVGMHFKESYTIGDTLNISEEELKLSYDDSIIEVDDYYLLMPSGKAISKSSMPLNEVGKHTFVIRGNYEGKIISCSYDFIVRDNLYGVQSSKSTVYYGKSVQYPEMGDGIVLDLARSDMFTFYKALDLNTVSKENPIITLAALAQTIGYSDASQIVIRLTDMYDANNFVVIRIKDLTSKGDWANSYAYVTANANGQFPMGHEGVDCHVNSEYGYPTYFSMLGLPSSGKFTDNFSLWYDSSEKAFYGSNPVVNGATELIADLDNRAVCTTLFNGFTNGMAILSITGEGYSASTMNLLISHVAGNEISKNNMLDVTAPSISIDYAGYTQDSIPNGVVGKEYPLFDVEAKDDYTANVKLTKAVYLNYRTSNATKYDVKDNGFVPDRKGIYTICYTAEDAYGNLSCVELPIVVQDAEEISVDYVDLKTELSIGAPNRLFDSINIDNGIGFYAVTGEAHVEYLGKVYAYPIDENYTFCPKYAGEYSITLRYNDFIHEVEYSYTAMCEEADASYIYQEVNLPKYFVKNATYALEDLEFYNYSEGTPNAKAADIYISEDNGNFVLISGKYTCAATNNVVVRYCDGNEQVLAEKEIPCVDTGFKTKSFELNKYFHTLSGEISFGYNTQGTTITTNGDASLEFINKVQISSLIFEFNVDALKNNFEQINVYITDSINSSIVNKFSYKKSGEGVLFSINDGDEYIVDLSFTGASSSIFKCNYEQNSLSVAVTNEFIIGISKDLYNKEFNGYPSGYAYLQMELEGVQDESSIFVSLINTQTFAKDTADKKKPEIIVTPSTGSKTLGDFVTINDAVAADVLDFDVQGILTVYDPFDEYVMSTSGVLLSEVDCDSSYEIQLSEYGVYYIEYYAKDSSGNELYYSYTITVRDIVDPTVTLGKYSTNGTVGKSFNVAKVTATDDYSQEVTVKVFVTDSEGYICEATNGKYTPKKAGLYTVSVYAYDEAHNVTIVEYIVTVS